MHYKFSYSDDIRHKLPLSFDVILVDPTSYRRLVGQLIYLSITHFEITYAIRILGQCMIYPNEDHLRAAHKVLRHMEIAPAHGIYYSASQPLYLPAY